MTCSKAILAIGAHPDDIEIGCGASLLKHIEQGDQVFALILTCGEGGNVHPKVRKQEAIKVAERIGYTCLDFGNISAFELNRPIQTYIDIIEDKIKAIEPSIVYCHTEYDRHQNHKIAAQCSLIAARFVNNVFTFELPSTSFGFNPTYFSDVTLTIDEKLRMLSLYQSQKEKHYMRPDAILGRAKDWAIRANMTSSKSAVEAFCVERMIA